MSATVQMIYEGQTYIGSIEHVTADRTIAYAVEGGRLVKVGEFPDQTAAMRAIPAPSPTNEI
jgi:hypothetical protein